MGPWATARRLEKRRSSWCDARLAGTDEQERPLLQFLQEYGPEPHVERYEQGHETATTGLSRCSAGDGGGLRPVASIRHDPARRAVPDTIQHVQEGRQHQRRTGRICAPPRSVVRQVVETNVLTGDEVAGASVVVREVAIVE